MIDKFTMKDGREVLVDFTNINSILSISREDMQEIREKISDSMNVVNSKIFEVNYLRSIGQLPDKKQYQKALDIVNDYQAIERTIAEEKAKLIEKDLKEVFKDGITEFNYKVETNFSPTDFKVVVYPIEPYFDEDYNGSYDKAMKAIGDKYSIRVFMTSGIYSK